ncbi:MAG: hypothetical protein AB7V50_01225 [Vampirovibrionia bacterium]
MFNKRELVLLISLAFCFGVIVSDFTKPKFIQAKTTNIIYDTLDAKIITLTRELNSVSSRVASLESTVSQKDNRIDNLSSTVKKISSIQKDLSVALDKASKDIIVLKQVQTQQQEVLKNR